MHLNQVKPAMEQLRPTAIAAALALALGLTLTAAPARAGVMQSEGYAPFHRNDAGNYPAVGAMLINNGTGLCSGTLIRKQWVLTAVHCVDTANSITFTIGGRTGGPTPSSMARPN